jgi:hypothetical protein
MIIVSNTIEGNEIKFIPRDGVENKVVLTDEVTGEVKEETLSFHRDGYYSVCTINTVLVDNRKYRMQVLTSTGEVLYNDLVFCSTQQVTDYIISNNDNDNFDSAPVDSAPQFIIID